MMSPEEAPRHIPGIPDVTQPLGSLFGQTDTAAQNQKIGAPHRAQGPFTPGTEPSEQHGQRGQAASPCTGGGSARFVLEASSLAIGWKQGRTPQILARNIAFRVSPGQLIALVGPNGAGKSTLLRTIAGLQPPCGGSLTLRGRNIALMSVEERATLLACVFNEKIEAGYLTVWEFVAFGRYPYTNAHNRLTADDRRHIATALALVGMDGFEKRTFSSLSDGERQKVQIARAVAQNTPLLVFDEPTAFLDAPSRIEIFRLAERLVQEAGKTVLLCTHEVDLALKTAGELWVIDREHRFTAGPPFVVARSGAIGRAFDLPTVAFDAMSGTFRARAPQG
jgi:iron complex transport system ATP-binding protein